MKLLIVSSEFPPGPGGIGTHAFQLARHLAEMGWDLLVLTPQAYAPSQEVDAFNASQAFQIVRLQDASWTPLKAFSRFRTLRRLVAQWSPDIVLGSGVKSVWLIAGVSWLQRFSWIAVAHGGIEFGTPSHWKRVLTRRSFSLADAVACVSHYACRSMREMGVRPRRHVVIPNGADEHIFRPFNGERVRSFRRRLGLEDASVLLTVGSVTERKGQEVVVRALPHLVKVRPDVHYVMAGLPLLRDTLTALAQQLGVLDRLHFLGRVDEETLVTAYNAADVFVMTSRHSSDGDSEGFGIAAVEAALCARPSVVSRGSGLEEAVLAEQTGLWVNEGDPEDTAHAILRLLRDKELHRKMGMQARERAVRELTWKTAAASYDRLLRDVLLSTHASDDGKS